MLDLIQVLDFKLYRRVLPDLNKKLEKSLIQLGLITPSKAALKGGMWF